MKNIYNTNCALFGYKTRQKEIAKIKVSDELMLKVKEKDNGYKDVFAYNYADEVGEFFRDESTDLLPFVSNPEKFKVKTIVKKLLSKEENMVSVIVDVSVFSEDNVDPDTYIEEFYNKKQENKINERNHIIVSNSPSEENKKIISNNASNTFISVRKINPILLKIKYIHGIPNMDKPCFVCFYPKKDGINFLNAEQNERRFFSLKREQIKNIAVEDQTTIEKRIGFKRLLLVGVFAFAWKKRQVNTLSYMVFEYVDDVGLTQEMYIQSEHKEGLQTFNNLKYNLYKFWKEAEENPDIDKVISSANQQYKIKRDKENSEAQGCVIAFIIIIVIGLIYLFFF